MNPWVRALAMGAGAGLSVLALNVAYYGGLDSLSPSALLGCLAISIPFALWGFLPQTAADETGIPERQLRSSFVVEPKRGWLFAITIVGLCMAALFVWALLGPFGV